MQATKYQQGLIIGKFAPLTLGHINIINQASTLCEKLIVVLSFNQAWLDKQCKRDQRVLTFKNRMRWLIHTYKDIEHVHITHLDESNLNSSNGENNWHEWVKLLDVAIHGYNNSSIINASTNINIHDITHASFTSNDHNNSQQIANKVTIDAIFSNAPIFEHRHEFKEYLPNADLVLIDPKRELAPVSTTAVRANLHANWGFLPSIVRRAYLKKVCLVGVESSGKTTMTKYLAKFFNTSWAEEYGRRYSEIELGADDTLLTSDDYVKIAYEQKNLESEACKTANSGVVFCDTNAFVTAYYHLLFEGYENDTLTNMFKAEKYDLVLLLTPDVPWVADGLRSQHNDNLRQRSWQLFQDMVNRYQPWDNVVTIDGDSYFTRLQSAISHVNALLVNKN